MQLHIKESVRMGKLKKKKKIPEKNIPEWEIFITIPREIFSFVKGDFKVDEGQTLFNVHVTRKDTFNIIYIFSSLGKSASK